MLVKQLDRIEDFDSLKNLVLDLIKHVQPKSNQISCQMTAANSTEWEEGIGSLINLADRIEKSYSHIPEKLQGSLLEKLIKKYNGFRTRIMIMEPRKCYSIHRDIFHRIHIPIVTNQQCWMIWPHDNYCSQLIAGNVYQTDTTQPHTFINAHNEEKRIHIIMSVNQYENQKI